MYKIHESSKVESKFHLSQLFKIIYCSSSLRQSIVQLSHVHPLSTPPSSSACRVLQFYPMFHFHGFIHCFTSPISFVLQPQQNSHKFIHCFISLNPLFVQLSWIEVFEFHFLNFQVASIVQLPLIDLLSNFFN
jgi:hypothetical protein